MGLVMTQESRASNNDGKKTGKRGKDRMGERKDVPRH